jgi:cytochrome c oxidase assembly protein subunit 15
MMLVHRLAWIALVASIGLVFAGAIVRVTGSGLGCPDWPTCWGCLIPPTSVDQIDVDNLDLEKFKTHAARKGIDPSTINRETILSSFNPVQTWIEFVNRLATLPLGLATLLLVIVAGTAKRNRAWIVGLAIFCLLDVVVNAVMGAMVVRSGLQPGIITLHMGLAFLLIIALVAVIWLSRRETQDPLAGSCPPSQLKIVSLVFVVCLFGEGLLGSQLREQTDELAIIAETEHGIERAKWGEEIAGTWVYKIHRSFSWSLLLTSGLLWFWTKRRPGGRIIEPTLIFALVVAMMLMGIVLGHLAIYPAVQVLHVGTTAILLAVTWHWIMRLWSMPSVACTNESVINS